MKYFYIFLLTMTVFLRAETELITETELINEVEALENEEIVTNTSYKADSDSDSMLYYTITADALTQTNGVTYYSYNNVYYRLVKSENSNLVYYSSYKEINTNENIEVVEGLPPLPDSVIKAIESIKIDETEKEEEISLVYEDDFDVSSVRETFVGDPQISDYVGINESIEGFNRTMFFIDDTLYVYMIGPIAKAYRWVVPEYGRKGISRMEYNLLMPKRLVNTLLQAKFMGSGIELTRFIINTTIGIAGFYDPATKWFDLPTFDVDTGQTFAKWGIGPGCYVYIPIFINHSTVRDSIGYIFDEALDPRTYIPFGSIVKAVMSLNKISENVDLIDQVREEQVDPYSYGRDMWYLYRTQHITE